MHCSASVHATANNDDDHDDDDDTSIMVTPEQIKNPRVLRKADVSTLGFFGQWAARVKCRTRNDFFSFYGKDTTKVFLHLLGSRIAMFVSRQNDPN